MLKLGKSDENLLRLQRLPMVVDAQGASQLLGVPIHEISTLTSAGILPALGKPAKNAVKYYSTAQLLNLAADEKWLSRAVGCIYRRHQERNGTTDNIKEKNAAAA